MLSTNRLGTAVMLLMTAGVANVLHAEQQVYVLNAACVDLFFSDTLQTPPPNAVPNAVAAGADLIILRSKPMAQVGNQYVYPGDCRPKIVNPNTAQTAYSTGSPFLQAIYNKPEIDILLARMQADINKLPTTVEEAITATVSANSLKADELSSRVQQIETRLYTKIVQDTAAEMARIKAALDEVKSELTKTATALKGAQTEITKLREAAAAASGTK